MLNKDFEALIKEMSELTPEEDKYVSENIIPEIIKEIKNNLSPQTVLSSFNIDGVAMEELSTLTDEIATLKTLSTNKSFITLIESAIEHIRDIISTAYKAKVFVELCHPDAQLPKYAHNGDMGADIYAVEDVIIEPHTYGNMIPTGLKFKIPFGWAVSIRQRSGMSKNTTLRISNVPATIDQNYRGEVKILFDNIGDEPIKITKGERIAQFVLEHSYTANFETVESVSPDTNRGTGGFGSSGSN